MSRRSLDVGMVLLYVGLFSLGLTTLFWILRGAGLLVSLPGMILLLLLVVTVATGVTGAVWVLRRY